MGHSSCFPHWLWRIAAASLWVLSTFPLCAHAQRTADSSEPAGYRALVEDGLREFSVQNYEEARALFLRAHALYPNARTHRALGLAEFELRNYGESIAHLEEALSSQVKPLSEDLRRDARAVLQRAYGFVARVSVQLRPPDARLMVNGEASDSKLAAPLILRIGEHTLEAEAEGFARQKRTVSVKGGEQLTVTFSLVVSNKDSARREAAVTQHAAQASRPLYKSPWFWVPTALVLAAGAGGTAFALTRDTSTERYAGSTGITLPGP